MSRMDEERDDVAVSRLLAGAANTIASVPYCWLVTAAETGSANARPMGLLRHVAGDNDWTTRFVTDGRSRKASEIRRGGKVSILFQSGAEDAFVTLIGRASLHAGAAASQHWRDAYNTYFPSETDRANATFVEVDVERMELWIRGVTPEPFGLHATILERDARGTWRLIPNPA